jgi:hypothetical protein
MHILLPISGKFTRAQIAHQIFYFVPYTSTSYNLDDLFRLKLLKKTQIFLDFLVKLENFDFETLII